MGVAPSVPADAIHLSVPAVLGVLWRCPAGLLGI